MLLVNEASGIKYRGKKGPVYYSEETDFFKHYFTHKGKIYSDKISKFVVQSNKKTEGSVISRINKLFDYIFIDEVQDLAGYDLELLKLLYKSSGVVILVGDPRQVTYLTHQPKKYSKYKNGGIKDFLESELPKKVEHNIDETTLIVSHRNNKEICEYSALLFPRFSPIIPCGCAECRTYLSEHQGVGWVSACDIDAYLAKYKPTQLRWDSRNTSCREQYPVMNFGESKGLSFDHVLIYPTDGMVNWIKNITFDLSDNARAKFYVAITRARHSVAIVIDDIIGNTLSLKKFDLGEKNK